MVEKAITFRFGDDETLETKTMAIITVGIAGVNGVLRVHVVLGGAPLLFSKLLKDFGCHVDLERGHFFENLEVRAVVTSKQSPHLLFPLTNLGSQGHKIVAEIHLRIRSDKCAIHRATCDSSKQDTMHLRVATTSERRPTVTDSIYTESHHSTDEQEQNPCGEAGDYWAN